MAISGSDERLEASPGNVDPDTCVWENHPLHMIRTVADAALGELMGEFARLYPARLRRPSIPPDQLLRAMLLQAIYGIRSERQLIDQMELDSVFRWFVGLRTDDGPWNHSSFATNRDRLLAAEIARKFLAAVIPHPRAKCLLASDHFSVDGTLLMAWVSSKSFRR